MDPEVPALERRIATAAAAVTARLQEVTDDLVELLTREIEALRDPDRLMSLLSASVAENVATLLHIFEHGLDPKTAEAPSAAIAYARRLAQRGVPIVALMRAYRIGQARFLYWCLEALTSENPHDPLLGEATRRMMDLSFTYIDRVSEQVIDAYQLERERWAENRSTVRMARVRSLLTADEVDINAMELKLGYRLRRYHLGVVVWFREQVSGLDELLSLERMVSRLGERAGSDGAPLFVPVDESSAWVWVPFGSERAAGQAFYENAIDDGTPSTCMCIGELGRGIDGFRRTHQQALRAQAVALAAGAAGPRVTAFADIRPIALMSSDLDGARAWVQDILGKLAIDDEPHARLRETLHVFLSAGGSYTAAAVRLSMHKNSVHYRVQKAEEILGKSVRTEERLEVQLALLACHWLGPAVLASAPDGQAAANHAS
jgi:DNA-binding PucR family transcriptional regulator